MSAASEIYDSASRISAQTTNSRVIGCSTQAMKHAEKADVAHNNGDAAAANLHLAQAAQHLQNASLHYTGTLKRGDIAPFDVLDHAHLGKSHELHQQYVDEINEGKKNGR